MNYKHIVTGEFLERPNRFVAKVKIGQAVETVHVKNTGRCRELLLPGATVYLEYDANPLRKTSYDLIAVQKGEYLINMDSQAPNKVVREWLESGGLRTGAQNSGELYDGERAALPCKVRPETVYGNSRFDFYVETESEQIFIEVKGVTLEEGTAVSFPDAPSERALKHLEELIRAKREGYRAIVLFVIQMERVSGFMPNDKTHPAFADLLRKAAAEGVEVMAFDCKVTKESLMLHREVPVRLWDSWKGYLEREA